jgi:hypothetical protein
MAIEQTKQRKTLCAQEDSDECTYLRVPVGSGLYLQPLANPEDVYLGLTTAGEYSSAYHGVSTGALSMVLS